MRPLIERSLHVFVSRLVNDRRRAERWPLLTVAVPVWSRAYDGTEQKQRYTRCSGSGSLNMIPIAVLQNFQTQTHNRTQYTNIVYSYNLSTKLNPNK